MNDRGAIQDENRDSDSRQDLTAAGNRRWFPLLPQNQEKSDMIYLLVILPRKLVMVQRAG